MSLGGLVLRACDHETRGEGVSLEGVSLCNYPFHHAVDVFGLRVELEGKDPTPV